MKYRMDCRASICLTVDVPGDPEDGPDIAAKKALEFLESVMPDGIPLFRFEECADYETQLYYDANVTPEVGDCGDEV